MILDKSARIFRCYPIDNDNVLSNPVSIVAESLVECRNELRLHFKGVKFAIYCSMYYSEFQHEFVSYANKPLFDLLESPESEV